MPKPFTTAYYSTHYPPIQRAKYEQVWPHLAPLLPAPLSSLLDVGIGPAWFEAFLAEKGVHIPRIVGVDVSEEAITPRKEGIDYLLDPDFHTQEKFDLVVCWDAYHLLKNKNLIDFVKPDGLLLVSEPPAFKEKLEELIARKKPVLDMTVGDVEKSRVGIWRVENFPQV